MKIPSQKYRNDPEYRYIVDFLESLIAQAKFTPSEIREACLLAAINYEMTHVQQVRYPKRVEGVLEIIERWTAEGE